MIPTIKADVAMLQQKLDRIHRKEFSLQEYAVACYVLYLLGENDGGLHPAKEDLSDGAGVPLGVVNSTLSKLSSIGIIAYQDLDRETVDILSGACYEDYVNPYADDLYYYATVYAWERLGEKGLFKEMDVYLSIVDTTFGSNQHWTLADPEPFEQGLPYSLESSIDVSEEDTRDALSWLITHGLVVSRREKIGQFLRPSVKESSGSIADNFHKLFCQTN